MLKQVVWITETNKRRLKARTIIPAGTGKAIGCTFWDLKSVYYNYGVDSIELHHN